MKLPVLVLSAVLLSGCGGGGDSPDSRNAAAVASASNSPSPTASPTPSPTPAVTPVVVGAAAGTDTGTGLLAETVLATIVVKGRGPKTGYSREAFGQAWADINRNGCDTRNDLLKRDLTALVFKAGTGECKVLSGTLADPYTAATIEFLVSGTSEVDIDHVVALGNAWVSGAARLTPDGRAALANDPLNLLAVDASANRQKGDGDAATWLPPTRGYRCLYVARQIAVKAKHKLSITAPEKAAMNTVLAVCPDQTVPSGGSATTAAGFGQKAAVPAPVTTTKPPLAPRPVAPRPATTTRPPAPRTTAPAPASVYYANCSAARAAGAAPLHRGDPGYRPALDRDKDGVACES